MTVLSTRTDTVVDKIGNLLKQLRSDIDSDVGSKISVINTDISGIKSSINTINTNINNIKSSYLPLSGGYMTGQIHHKHASLKKGTAPSATTWDLSWIAFDSAGTATANRLAELRHGVDTSQSSFTDLMAYGFASGSTTGSYIRMLVNSSNVTSISLNATNLSLNGTNISAANNSITTLGHTLNMKDSTNNHVNPVIRVYTDGAASGTNYGFDVCYGGNGATYIGGGESPVNLRSAINDHSENLHLSADGEVNVWTNCNTIANRNRWRWTGNALQTWHAGITRGTAPSSNAYMTLYHGDKDGNYLSRIRFQYTTAKRHGVYLEACNDAGTNYGNLGIFVDAEGTAAYTQAPTPATTDSSTKIATTAYVRNNMAVSLAQNGHLTLGNGLILQWGRYSVESNNSPTVTFPKAFPSACYSVVMSMGSWSDDPMNVGSISTTGFKINTYGDTTYAQTIKFFAIGK